MKNSISQLFKGVSSAITATPLEIDIPAEWLLPVSGRTPCGPSLNYDPEFAVLAARLQPKTEVQYGQFTATPPEPDWKEIERDCRRLMLRSKDLNLLLWFTRSRTRQAGATGLLQGLSAMQQVCELFGDAVHPQLQIEGECDPMVRASTLGALCDPEGLLGDVRELLIVPGTAQRLSVRDVERALTVPRPPYAPDPQSVRQQLADLHLRRDSALLTLHGCAACTQFLQGWAQQSMGDEAPDLQPLMSLFAPLLSTANPGLPSVVPLVHAEAVEVTAAPVEFSQSKAPSTVGSTVPTHWPATHTSAASALLSREQVRDALAQVRLWIEQHEPSSPVSVLIKQAERMWGKRFSEIAHMIPLELLKEWDQEN